jgi:hydrogenase maturation protease
MMFPPQSEMGSRTRTSCPGVSFISSFMDTCMVGHLVMVSLDSPPHKGIRTGRGAPEGKASLGRPPEISLKEGGSGMRVRVIACGNPLMGNDAAGPAVLALLAAEYPEIDAVDGGTGGLGLVTLMEGYDRIVIVDATSGMGEPGEIRVFRDLPASGIPSLSLHEIGIPEALALARALGSSPEVVIVGIEGGRIQGFSVKMDPAVAAAIPVAAGIVAGEVRRAAQGGG